MEERVIVGNDIGLVLSKGDCKASWTAVNNLLILTGKSKTIPKDYYKTLQKMGVIHLMEKLKDGGKEVTE